MDIFNFIGNKIVNYGNRRLIGSTFQNSNGSYDFDFNLFLHCKVNTVNK